MCNKQQAAGLVRIRFTKVPVVKCRDGRFFGACGRDYKVTVMAAVIVAEILVEHAICFQLSQNLLLVVVRIIHGMEFDVNGIDFFFGLECADQPLFLILRIVLKIRITPVGVIGGGDCVDDLRQILFGYFCISLQAVCQRCTGKI